MSDTQRHFTISRTDHTGITVTSLKDSLHFWVDVLGFRLISQSRFDGPFLENIVGVKGADASLALLDAYGHKIELLEYHAPANRQTMKPQSCDVGSVHVAFVVDNMDAVLHRVQESGWHTLGETQTIKDGDRAATKLMYIRGPDGGTVEFLEVHGKAQ